MKYPPEEKHPRLDASVSTLVCQLSATMVGLCMTGIGLLRVTINLTHIQTLADDILAIDALGFLAATLASYLSLRKRHLRRSHLVEMIADICFIGSMILLVVACFYITYAISQ